MYHAAPIYPNLDAFHEADPRQLRSEQFDYGVHWRLDGWEYRWRVSYIRDTGEICAVHQGSTIGPVIILGIVTPDEVPLFEIYSNLPSPHHGHGQSQSLIR